MSSFIRIFFIILIFLLLTSKAHSQCSADQEACGDHVCYNPRLERCNYSANRISCIHTCNGTCFSDFEICYYNLKICYQNESVCNVSKQSISFWGSSGLTCYNPSSMICSNGALCDRYYSCGAECLNYDTACVNNETICRGFYYGNLNVELCGPRMTCYDNTTQICLNNSIVCSRSQSELCGTICFDPTKQVCINGTVRCLNSCNGTCFSNSSFCYDNKIICNKNESVCNVTKQSISFYGSSGLTCYNPSSMICSNGALCYRYYSCGAECLNYDTACVNNETICRGFYYGNLNVELCGPRMTCYDNTTQICLNNSIVCSRSQTKLCGNTCFDPTKEICINGTVQCLNSCNGTCYSNQSYCYDNKIICNKSESVCNVTRWTASFSSGFGATCYNQSMVVCLNGGLCDRFFVCGADCLDTFTTCVNNRTICFGFYYWNQNVRLCGPSETCYDTNTHTCAMNTTLCPLSRPQLCGSICFDPTKEICINGTVRCLNSCNGTCYSNESYCHDNKIICNRRESVCNVSKPSISLSGLSGLTCYDPLWMFCLDSALCERQYVCGARCLNYSSACADNVTYCEGFSYWNQNLRLCGRNRTCYDYTSQICMMNSTVCAINQSELCGTICFDPTKQVCINGTVRCLNSCNGTCFSNSSFCYANKIICNKNESVCNVSKPSLSFSGLLGSTCYNPSSMICSNGALCYRYYSCGAQCLNDDTACVNNETICKGFSYWNRNVGLCGPRMTCYDNTTQICLNNSIVCSRSQSELCGTICFDPTKQVCINGTVRCLNSCNGTCFSNSSFCYDNKIICNKNESVCNVSKPSLSFSGLFGLTCYNPSSMICSNGALCDRYYSCGAQCLNYDTVCVNNETICKGFSRGNQYVGVCGPNKTCYDKMTQLCFYGTSVCPIARHDFCGSTCIDPIKQICINGTARCLNSCNGTCYSNDSYCTDDKIICLKNQSVCNVTRMVWPFWYESGLTCYDRTWSTCWDGTVCYNILICGLKCLNHWNSTCVNNETICSGFYYWNTNVKLCGEEKICYDNTTHVCYNDSGVVCPLEYGLCDSTCFDPLLNQCCNGALQPVNATTIPVGFCIESTNVSSIRTTTRGPSTSRSSFTSTSSSNGGNKKNIRSIFLILSHTVLILIRFL